MKLKQIFLAAALSFGAASAFAQPCTTVAADCDPPAGNVIFDLAGQPIPHTYTQYTVTFNAALATTALSFQMREDPAYWFLDDIVLTHNGVGPNLLTNGDFEGGTYVGAGGNLQPTGWTYLNLYNAAASGRVATNNPHGGANNYYDGAVYAYDGITQNVATIIGDSYTLTFWLSDNSSQTTARRLCSDPNCSDPTQYGIDLLVYAGALPTIAVPEPSSIALLGLGVTGLALARRRKQK